MNNLCADIGYKSINHEGEQLCGDHVDIVEQGENSTVIVLADGLGSGVKASILSTLTSKIISTMMAEGLPLEECVSTIAATLPICSQRGVAYSTFTILHLIRNETAELIQYDNPAVIFLRNFENVDYPMQELHIGGKQIYKSSIRLQEDDIFIAMSDGCPHAGIGIAYNFGWKREEIMDFMASIAPAGYTAKTLSTMLVDECEKGNVAFRLRSEVLSVAKDDTGFTLELNGMTVGCEKLVIATGGLSMPGLGASPFGYKIAEQFGLNVLPTRAGLVPFTLHKPLLEELQVLAGVAVPSVITAENGTVFRENLLFTHRGLSGPAVLQISSYWQPGEFVSINLLPDVDLETFLNEQRNAHPNQSLKNTLAVHLPKRLVERLQQLGQIPDLSLKQLNVRDQQTLISTLTDWRVQPNGTEGYRTAEVTLGGVDTNELSSRTMEARKVPGLYFIGEVMDVTGWLGGYNFQWAWSSAWACAQDLVAE